MKIFFSVIGFVMLADALFTWANMEKVEHMLKKAFPNLNVKKFVWIEGLAGAGILITQMYA